MQDYIITNGKSEIKSKSRDIALIFLKLSKFINVDKLCFEMRNIKDEKTGDNIGTIKIEWSK